MLYISTNASVAANTTCDKMMSNPKELVTVVNFLRETKHAAVQTRNHTIKKEMSGKTS